MPAALAPPPSSNHHHHHHHPTNAQRGDTFDLVILDPPSTSTTGGARGNRRWSAARDYGALAGLAAACVSPAGGLLWTTTNHRGLAPRAFARLVAAGLPPGAALDRVAPPAADFPVPAGGSPEVKNLVWRIPPR